MPVRGATQVNNLQPCVHGTGRYELTLITSAESWAPTAVESVVTVGTKSVTHGLCVTREQGSRTWVLRVHAQWSIRVHVTSKAMNVLDAVNALGAALMNQPMLGCVRLEKKECYHKLTVSP